MLDNGQDSDGRGAVAPPTVRVAVVGVGRIGVHRAVTFAEAGVDVVGYDVDESRIAAYRRGHDPTGTVDDDRLVATNCSFTADPACLADADLVFVAVPTRHDPDASEPHATIRSVGRTVGEHCTPGTTAVLESTVPPGTTADVFAPAIDGATDHVAGAPIDVAYAPERFSMGSSPEEWRAEPRLVGADDPAVAARVSAAYELVYDTVHVVEGTAVAEAAKCVENVYRDATIAVVNELAGALSAMGVDADRALEAAATKRNVPDLDPGIVGGRCLPEDPLLFAARANEVGESMPLVRTARAVNDGVVDRVVDTTVASLAARERRVARETPPPQATGPPVEHAAVLSDGAGGTSEPPDRAEVAPEPSVESETVVLAGLAYKPDVSDLTGSRCIEVATRLAERGVDVVGYDPLVDADTADRSLPFSVRETDPFDDVDGVVVLVGHTAFDDLSPESIASAAAPEPAVVDLPRTFDRSTASRANVVYRCP